MRAHSYDPHSFSVFPEFSFFCFLLFSYCTFTNPFSSPSTDTGIPRGAPSLMPSSLLASSRLWPLSLRVQLWKPNLPVPAICKWHSHLQRNGSQTDLFIAAVHKMLSQRQGWGQGMGVGVMQDALFPPPESPGMLTWEKYLTSSPHALYSLGNYVVSSHRYFQADYCSNLLSFALHSFCLPSKPFCRLKPKSKVTCKSVATQTHIHNMIMLHPCLKLCHGCLFIPPDPTTAPDP